MFLFWKKWPVFEKYLFFFGGLVLLVFLFSALVAFYSGGIPWDIASELLDKVYQENMLTLGGIEFNAPQVVHYVKEYYLAGETRISTYYSVLLIFAYLLGLTMIQAGLAGKGQLAFLISLVISAMVALFLQPSLLLETASAWPFLVFFSLPASMAFYFHSSKRMAAFLYRFGLFLVAHLALFLFMFFRAKTEFPLVAFSHFFVPSALLISAVFIFWVAQEIPRAMVGIVSYSSVRGKSNLPMFIWSGLLYLVVILLIYLENNGFLDTKISSIHPFYLLLSSSVLGVWGLYSYVEQRQELSFLGAGFWLYGGAGILTWAVIAFAFSSANDSLFNAIMDFTSAAFLAVGLAFLIHILINFQALFKQGLSVHKVFWKPVLSKLIFARLGAFFILSFLVSQQRFFILDQGIAGVYNTSADYWAVNGESKIAESFYQKATEHDFVNHKSNYSLSRLAKKAGDRKSTTFYLWRAAERVPYEQDYVALSTEMEEEGLYFDGLFALKEGLVKFPKSAYLFTNLSRLLEKAKQTDSVFLYRDLALENCVQCDVEKNNLLAFWIENGKQDLLAEKTKNIVPKNREANVLALEVLMGKGAKQDLPKIEAKPLNVEEMATLYNQILLGNYVPDSILLYFQQNTPFAETCTYARALNAYAYGNKVEALKRLEQLSLNSNTSGILYKKQLAGWYLQQGVLSKAIKFYQSSGDEATSAVAESKDIADQVDKRNKYKALDLTKRSLNLENWKEVYKEMPLNVYLLETISTFLQENNQELEAYRLWVNTSELLPENPMVWKNYALLALKNGVRDYAEEAKNSYLKVEGDLAAKRAFLEIFESEKRKIDQGF